MICSLFGHGTIFKKEEVQKRLKSTLLKLIDLGYSEFLVGIHGDFDKIALSVCRELKREQNIKINLIFTSLNYVQREFGDYEKLYSDINFVSYPIENYYFKNQITMNNRFMVDDSDLVLCYVDREKTRSGAKMAMNYAIKFGKKVVNIFEETDRSFYGLTREEIEVLFKKYIEEE